jgi:hypothetical protein
MGYRFCKEESMVFLIVLNRQIELVTHIIDVALHGFSGNLEFSAEERAIRSALGLDGLIDESHPRNRHSRYRKPGDHSSGHPTILAFPRKFEQKAAHGKKKSMISIRRTVDVLPAAR